MSEVFENGKLKIDSRQLPDHVDIPRGPPPKETSSMRVLPDVHAALRQNNPSMVGGSQPVLKKAPPSSQEGRCQRVSIPTRNLQGLVQH